MFKRFSSDIWWEFLFEFTIELRQKQEVKEIMVTDGVRHSVPLEEISTLLDPDGIPSIDNPKFVSIFDADKFLPETELYK